MSRTSALLWLALALGTTAGPLHAEVALAAPVEEVKKHLNAGRIDAAIESGESAVEALAQDSFAWVWLGRAYAQQAIKASLLGKPRWARKARDAYEKAVALDGSNLEARYDLLQYYLAAPGFLGGGRDKAVGQVTALRERDTSMGFLAAALLARHDGQAAEVERLLREGLKLDPGSTRLRYNLSWQLQADKRWGEIRALWEELLAVNPDDPLAHYQLGRLSAVSGEALDAGLSHLDAFLANPRTSDAMSPAAAQWRRGQILEKLGRRAEAIAAIEEALRLEPELAQARTDLDRLQDA